MGGLTAMGPRTSVVGALVALCAAGFPVSAWAQAPRAGAVRPRMPAHEAIATFAEFLRVDTSDIELVRESESDKPDTEFAGVVRHEPPTDAPWWGPRDDHGMAQCLLLVGRRRDNGGPYVREAWWHPDELPGGQVVKEDEIEAISRAFVKAYCPFYEDGLELAPAGQHGRSDGRFGHTYWSRETDTTSLRVIVVVSLDDGSMLYSCWYRTGLTPAAIGEEQARQIAEEQWRAKYPEQELVYQKAAKLLESEFSPTRGPVWRLTYRHGPERDPMDLPETEYAWLMIDAVTGAILQAPDLTSPKLTKEEAQRICAEQWLAKWPDEKLEIVSARAELASQDSPSHGPVWVFTIGRSTEGALPVREDWPLLVCIDALTGEVLRAPNLTKPKLSEADAEQVYQAEWVTKWPGDTLAPPTIHGFLDSPKSPTHGPVWVFAYQHNREGVHSYDVEVVMDALTGVILEGPDFSEGRPRQVKQ